MAATGAAIAVNVSGISIGDAGFVTDLLNGLAGVPAGRLLIELTETAEIQDLPAAAAQIARLRAAHLSVCLDDFGAGNASFSYIRDLPVDYVKIDGSHVRAASRSEQGRSVVRAMCELARTRGATTIAEMIETEADAGLMRQLNVNYGQGWLFGKPGPLPQGAESPARWRY